MARSYVANEQQFLAAVEEGKQALKEGRVIDHNTRSSLPLSGSQHLTHDAAQVDDTGQ
jgi:hypothetical protein